MKECIFDDRNNMEEVLVFTNDYWFAFVPNEPEIFGHILLTTDKRHIAHIEDAQARDLEKSAEGIVECTKMLRSIDNVERVYIAVLGESSLVHLHYHLFPRYGFRNREERKSWTEKYSLSHGPDYWKKFYGLPALSFYHKDGFQYLGEVERTYNFVKEIFSSNEPPPLATLKEIATILRDAQ